MAEECFVFSRQKHLAPNPFGVFDPSRQKQIPLNPPSSKGEDGSSPDDERASFRERPELQKKSPLF
jgi:hypothetical protein